MRYAKEKSERKRMSCAYDFFDNLMQPKRKRMRFMEYHNKLQECFRLFESDRLPTPEHINAVTEKVFSSESYKRQDERRHQTYNNKDTIDNIQVYFPLSFMRIRDTVYRNYFGYSPTAEQLPRYIDFARAYAMMEPPPNLDELTMWETMLENNVPREPNLIVVNTVVAGRTNVREYRVFSPQALEDVCSMSDLGAGEVFSSQLWCSALTFDVDGKTHDAILHGWGQVYPIKEIELELLTVLREEMLLRTNRRWDARKIPPAIHTWTPDNAGDKKLSLRISIHLPPNICFQCIDDLAECVKHMCLRLVKNRSRYLTVKHVTVNGMRFEKSHLSYNSWIGLSSQEGEPIDLVQYLDGQQNATITLRNSTVQMDRKTSGFLVTSGESQSKIIHNVHSWITKTIETDAMLECLIDDKIYHNNKSLRLPLQSKMVEGMPVRRLIPSKEDSRVLDALIHFPHNDTPLIPGDFLLISCNQRWKAGEFASSLAEFDVESAKSVIESQHNMTVTKVTKQGGVAFLDVEPRTLPTPSLKSNTGNFCLIKGDWHTSARMFFVLNEKGDLTISCWSSKCKSKQA